MAARRTIALFLDGYEVSLEERWAAEGRLPNLSRLRADSARFRLNYGPAQRTGLAGEHVSTGRSPEACDRWSAVEFDRHTYQLWQEGTRQAPFARDLRARTVVFDMPYFDLEQAPNVRGMVSWGAHDPGVAAGARPAALTADVARAIGPYPAQEFIYGLVWASPAQTRDMGERLAAACDLRTKAVTWLLGERLPDWDLALVSVSEPHSAIEGLWHGVDAAHPLHTLPSAAPAGAGLLAVYQAVDRLVGTLSERFPDASLVLFSMGGMGPNRSDVASMLLLSELCYRHAFGTPLFQPRADWTIDRPTGPLLGEREHWNRVVTGQVPLPPAPYAGVRRFARDRLPRRVGRAVLRGLDALTSSGAAAGNGGVRVALGWMPASRYQPYWSRMPFFALPSFYDGRVRINLKGRERHGRIPLSRYTATCDAVEQLVRECRDPISGEAAVDFVERPRPDDPLALRSNESDLVVVWKGVHCALDHPRLGRLGPAPFRRPGGHTGPLGMAYIRAQGFETGDYGTRSSFDVVPTICELLGESVPAGVSGASLFTAPPQTVVAPTPNGRRIDTGS